MGTSEPTTRQGDTGLEERNSCLDFRPQTRTLRTDPRGGGKGWPLSLALSMARRRRQKTSGVGCDRLSSRIGLRARSAPGRRRKLGLLVLVLARPTILRALRDQPNIGRPRRRSATQLGSPFHRAGHPSLAAFGLCSPFLPFLPSLPFSHFIIIILVAQQLSSAFAHHPHSFRTRPLIFSLTSTPLPFSSHQPSKTPAKTTQHVQQDRHHPRCLRGA